LFIYKYVYVRLFFSVAYAPNTKFIEKPKQLTLIVRVISPTRACTLSLSATLLCLAGKERPRNATVKRRLGKWST